MDEALLNVFANNEGHLEFKAEILDDAGNATSADLGHTYRKLLCIAFDLAILQWQVPRRMPGHGVVQEPNRSESRDRGLARPLQ
jgi:uncharacterized protein YydD (DUF2326 family)